MDEISTTYIHKNLSYFFTRNEVIDLEIGMQLKMSINSCLDVLEQTIPTDRQGAPSTGNANEDTEHAQQKLSSIKHKLLDACLALLAHITTVELSSAP
jgi:hypothetical protein